MKVKTLDTDFFLQSPKDISIKLLGKKIHFYNKCGIITETEYYLQNEKNSHSFKGLTEAKKSMFALGGTIYIYLIYGMYYCLNISCNEEGVGNAILIRGLFADNFHYNGPGKLTKYLGITKKEDGLNVVNHPDIFIEDIDINLKYDNTTRIGLNKKYPCHKYLRRFMIKKDEITKLVNYN